MERLEGSQLSFIAETEFDAPSSDWAVDVDPAPPLRERSYDEIREHFVSLASGGQIKNSQPHPVALHSGGQPQTRITPMEGNGGQTSPNDGGQNKNRLFDRSEGDDGTWVEIQHRKNGSFKYLRWREFKSGIKRSKYLGKVS